MSTCFYIIKCINVSQNESCNNSDNFRDCLFVFFPQYVFRAGSFRTIVPLHLPRNALPLKGSTSLQGFLSVETFSLQVEAWRVQD